MLSSTAVLVGSGLELHPSAQGVELQAAIAQAQAPSTQQPLLPKQSESRRPKPKRHQGSWFVTQRGAGSRSCGDAMELQLPVDSVQEAEDSVSKGLLSEPILEIKVPYTSEELVDLSFILQDEDYAEIYKLEALKPSDTGILRIEIPEDKLNNNAYRWFVEAEINCPPPQLEISDTTLSLEQLSLEHQGTGKPRLSGWLERDTSTSITIPAESMEEGSE